MERLFSSTVMRWITNAVLVVLALGVLAGVYNVVTKDRSVKPGVSAVLPVPTASVKAIRAIVFGDSIVAGANTGAGNATFVDVASKLLGWTSSPFGFPGSGFTTAGTFTGGRDYEARLQQLRGYDVDVVLIEGGLNDGRAPAALLRAKVGLVVDRAHALLPRAQIVLMGPYSPSVNVAPDVRATNRVMREVAAARKIPYVDPIAEAWITGEYPTAGTAALYIGPDRVYPNTAGHAYFGRRLAADLKRLLSPALVHSAS